jgi:hypothetical protein
MVFFIFIGALFFLGILFVASLLLVWTILGLLSIPKHPYFDKVYRVHWKLTFYFWISGIGMVLLFIFTNGI